MLSISEQLKGPQLVEIPIRPLRHHNGLEQKSGYVTPRLFIAGSVITFLRLLGRVCGRNSLMTHDWVMSVNQPVRRSWPGPTWLKTQMIRNSLCQTDPMYYPQVVNNYMVSNLSGILTAAPVSIPHV